MTQLGRERRPMRERTLNLFEYAIARAYRQELERGENRKAIEYLSQLVEKYEAKPNGGKA
jgi:histone H3/H4